MKKESMDFLKKIMTAPSPSGYEDRVRKLLYEKMSKYDDNVRIDVHGNVIASTGGDNSFRIMLAGHMDELGFQIKYIDDNGFIYFNTLGGFDVGIIPGRKVRIFSKKGEVLGVLGKKAIHLFEKEDREKVPKLHQLYIDIGAKDKKEAEKHVSIGDAATYDANFDYLLNDFCVSRAFDDKIGAFIVAEVLKNASSKKDTLGATVYSVATVQEEVGLRGATTAAYSINPHIGIAIDVTHATDTPDVDIKKDGDIKSGMGVTISRGPNTNQRIFDLLHGIALDKGIPFQIEADPRPTGTDANVIQVSRDGTAAGLLSIPCRYMHTNTEMISLADVESTIALLTEFCLTVNEKTELTPYM